MGNSPRKQAFILAVAVPVAGSSCRGEDPASAVEAAPWTYGALANHLCSYAGNDALQEVDLTYLQPFLSYTTKTQTTYSLNTESTYDWTNTQWTVPINVAVSQLVKIGEEPVQSQLAGRYYADAPVGGTDWGLGLECLCSGRGSSTTQIFLSIDSILLYSLHKSPVQS